MAIQRVPGQMLEENLTRSSDLAFQTDLLYLDVSNNRVGIKTATPGNFALDVNGTAHFQDSVTITGNLTVTGQTTVVSTTNMEIEDNILVLNSGGSTGNDAGIMINRNGIADNAVFYWDEVDDKFKFVITPSDGSTVTSVDDSVLARIAVATPIDGDDAVTKNYVDSAISGVAGSFNIADDGSTTSNVLLNDTLQFLGGNNIATTVSDNTVTFTGSKDININSITSDDSTAIQINDGLNVAGNIDMQGNSIVGVADPNNAQDVATKAYVDAQNQSQALTFVGDDSTGTLVSSGETFKVAGATGITTAVSGDTLTITGPDLTSYATETYVGTQISNLVASAPEALDTLNELAAALGDDANFATTITNSLASKVAKTDTGLIVVGDDSTGTALTVGETFKVAGAQNITTAVSGDTLTITGPDLSSFATTSYVDAQNIAQSLTFVGDDSTGTLVSSGETFKVAGAGGITTSVAGDTLTITGATDLTVNSLESADSTAIQINDGLNVAGNIDVQGNTVTGLGTPSADSDAATKAYVDTRISANNSLTVGGDDSSEITLDLDTSLNVKGGTNISTSVAGDTLTITGATDLTVNSLESADSTAIQINDGLNVAGATTVNNTLNVTGAATLGTSLTLPTGATVTAILDEDTMSSNSDTALATQQSIKAYVDAQIVATNTLNISDDTSSEVSLDLDNTLQILGGNNITTAVSGDNKLTITGSKDININSITSDDSTAIQINDGLNVAGNIDVQGNTVTGLGTPSADSDAATKAYVDAQNQSQALTFVGDDSTGTAVNSGEIFKIAGTQNITTAVSGDTLTITGPDISSFITATSTDTLQNKTIDSTQNTITITESNISDLGAYITASSTDALTNKTFDANGTGNSITNIEVADFAAGVLDTDLSSASASDDTLASAKAIKAYVDAQNQSQALTFVGDDSTGTAVNSGEIFKIAGTQNITTAVSGDTLTITGPDLSSYATQSYVTSQGYITNSTTTIVGDDSTGTTLNSGETFKIAGGNNITTSVDNDVLSIQGATDINVNSITSTDSSAIQVNDHLNVAGNINIVGTITATGDGTFEDVRVRGNLTVDGTQTILNTETLSIEDNIIVLNRNVSGAPAADAGIEINRGDEASKSLLWNESTDKWTVGSDTFVAGTFEGNLTGNVTGNADTATSMANVITVVGDDSTGTTLNSQETFKIAGNTNITTAVSGDTLTITGSKDININSITSDDSTAIQINDGLNVAGNIDVQGNTVTGLGTPSADSDAATKAYVDTQVSANNSLTLGADDSSEITLNLDTTLNIKGGTGITTSVTGDTLTITGVNQAQGISFGDNTSSTIAIPDGGTLNLVGTGGVTAIVTGDTLTIDGSAVAADLGTFTFSGNKITQTASNADFEIDNAGSGNFTMLGTSALVIPKGTVAERPSSIVAGSIRYNTDNSVYEISEDGNTWLPIKTGTANDTVTNNTVLKTLEYNKLTTSSTVVDEFDQYSTGGAFYHIGIEDISNNLVGQLNINIVHDTAGNVYHTLYDLNEDSTNLVSWSTNVSGNNIQLVAQANSSNHVNLKIQKISLNAINNRLNFTNSSVATVTEIVSGAKKIISFPLDRFNGAKIYTLFQNTDNNVYEVRELLVARTGPNVYLTGYGNVITAQAPLVTYTVSIAGTEVIISASNNGGGEGTITAYSIQVGDGTNTGSYNNVTYNKVGDVDTTNAITVDSFSVASRRTAKYIINLHNTEGLVQTSEISLIHNGSDAFITEQSISSGTSLGIFTTDVSNGRVRLRVQGSGQQNTSIVFARFDYEQSMFYKDNNDATGVVRTYGTSALHLPVGTTAQRPTAARGVIRFNSQTSKYEVSLNGSTWVSLKTEGTIRAVTKDVFLGDGSTQTFTSANVDTDEENLLVYIDGIMQEPTENYTTDVEASTVTITDEAPHEGARIVIIRGFAEDLA